MSLCESRKRMVRGLGILLLTFLSLPRAYPSPGQLIRTEGNQREVQLAARQKPEEAKKDVPAQPADADRLLRLAHTSADAEQMADAVRLTSEALRTDPNSARLMSEHLAMLYRAKEYIAVEKAAPAAADLAIAQNDQEALARILDAFSFAILDDVRTYVTGIQNRGNLPDRLKNLKPMPLAKRALKTHPDDPRLVMALLRIRNQAIRFPMGDAGMQLTLDLAPAAILEAHRRGYWETTCLLGEEYWLELGCSSRDLTPAQKQTARAAFDAVVDAALHLQPEKEPVAHADSAWEWPPSQIGRNLHFAIGYKATLWILSRDIKTLDLRDVDETVSRFRNLADKAIPDKNERRLITEGAEKELMIGLAESGDQRLVAKASQLANAYVEDRESPEDRVRLMLQSEAGLRAEMKAMEEARSREAPKPSAADEEYWHTYFQREYIQMKRSLDAAPDDRGKRDALNREVRDICDALIETCFRTKRYTEAFEAAEWLQGLAMRNVLGERRLALAERNLGDAKARIQAEKSALADMAAGSARRTSAGQTTVASTRDLKVEAQALEQRAQAAHALEEQVKITRSKEPLHLDQIKSMLDADTTLLFCHPMWEIYVPPDKAFVAENCGFVAIVTRDGLDINWSPELTTLHSWGERNVGGLRTKCRKLLDSLRAGQAAGAHATRNKEFLTSSQDLYSVLIAPIRGKLKTKRLVIVPSDDLFGIPFGLLADEKGRYLCEDFAISYAPSATVLDLCLKQHRPLGDKALILANPALADPAYALKFAEEEARQIAALYPGARCYVGTAATQTALREGLAGSSIIHIASHAVFDMDNPMASFLMLAEDKGKDGVLTANDIMGLSVSAQLVTLSACETGRGEVSAARQEVLGLLRAWMFAGAPSVVVSLWKLDDKATSELMAEFYKNLKTMSRAEALQRAQLTMMKKYENPYYWGAFVLYGDYR